MPSFGGIAAAPVIHANMAGFLPDGTPVEVYASVGASFNGTISIASPLSMTSGDMFASYGSMLRSAAQLFAIHVNSDRQGLRVGARGYAIKFTFVDDASSKDQVGGATAFALSTSEANFATGPYSSGLTKVASSESSAQGRIMMASAAASTSAFGSNLTFGVLPPAQRYLANPIAAIADKAGKLGMLSSLRMGFIQADAVFR